MRARLLLASLGAASVLAAPAPAHAAGDPLLRAIQQAEAAGAVPPPQGLAYRDVLARARATRDALRGVRRREMAAALRVAASIANGGRLTPARMPAVFLTLRRNAEWWAAHGPPVAGSPGESGARGRRCRPLPARARAARVEFAGSELVFQYYRGLGLQIQVNGTWARANALLGSTNPAFVARGAALLNELLPLAVLRDGVLAWEYLFPIFGGRPPWISALSQATAVQAMTRAAAKLGRPDLLTPAAQAAGAFAFPPPAGVRVLLGRGQAWYVLYSFAPRQRVLNAHLQALAALFDFAQASADPHTRAAYDAGLLAARRRIGGFDTGVWSKYANPGALADLNYHVLNRDLARGVCRRSADRAICRAARSFSSQLERRCPRPAAATARPAGSERVPEVPARG
ncbi:MAG TPA: D-glucuronyl C5-epimerase family protein [Solirubrobacteraceae bacterium]|nr:D-glucuronyl C5-epimerase family protein [Solirubrobacteraceae bacterium]